MTQAMEHVCFDDAVIERHLSCRSGTDYRVLMHLWAMSRAESMGDIIASIRMHRTRVRRSLRSLINDGLVAERDGDGGTMYVLTEGHQRQAGFRGFFGGQFTKDGSDADDDDAWRTRRQRARAEGD